MSKKPRDEFDRIVMDEKMKKRILHKVFDDNSEVKSIDDYKIKKNVLIRKRMSGIAACFTLIMCLNVVKNYPQLFKDKFDNLKQEEISENTEEATEDTGYKNSELEVNDNNESSELKEGSVDDQTDSDDYKNHKNESKKNQINNNTINNVVKGENSVQSDNNEDIKDSVIKNPAGAANEDTRIEADSKIPGIVVPENNTNGNDALNSAGNPNINDTPSKGELHGNSSDNNEHSDMTPPLESSEPGESSDEVSGGEQSSDNLEDPLQGVQLPGNSGDSSEEGQLPGDGENSSIGHGCAFEKECTTLEEAEGIVKFKINSIQELPGKFEVHKVSVIVGELIQIMYKDDLQEKIIFRAAKDIENISGDYNVYSFNDKYEISGAYIELKGNDENLINLAEWKNGDISYSISAADGISQDDILNMIESSL